MEASGEIEAPPRSEAVDWLGKDIVALSKMHEATAFTTDDAQELEAYLAAHRARFNKRSLRLVNGGRRRR